MKLTHFHKNSYLIHNFILSRGLLNFLTEFLYVVLSNLNFVKTKVVFLILSFLSVIDFSSKAETCVSELVIWSKNGTKVTFSLFDKPKVIFEESSLVVCSNGMEVYYEVEDLKSFTFEKHEGSLVKNVALGIPSLKKCDETLIISNVEENSIVYVYNINGILLFQHQINAKGEYALPLSVLPSGISVVNINGLTYKIIK